ncbi:MAG: tetratricopeptide repeat protein [Planctomycetota bacterium]|nr:MAG: tetratricopeptide repeat protein [Planctomycetota bacterium]
MIDADADRNKQSIKSTFKIRLRKCSSSRDGGRTRIRRERLFTLHDHLPTRLLIVLILGLLGNGCNLNSQYNNSEGVKLYQQGNYQGAVDKFQQALAGEPGSPDCFYNLGATYHQQAKLFSRPSDLQLAEQYYHLCLDRNPDHHACQRALAVLLVEEKRGPEAVGVLDSWAKRQPNDPNPHIELARLSEEIGDLRGAENHLIDGISIDPNNTRALVALGRLREMTGEPQQALANYQRALGIEANQPAVSARVAALSTSSTVSDSRMASLPTQIAPTQPANNGDGSGLAQAPAAAVPSQ